MARGDPAGVLLVAVTAEQVDQLALVGVVDEVGCGGGPAAVHAHVEGGIGTMAEPAVGSVELRRADPEVEQHSRQRRQPELCHHRGQTVEAGLDDTGPVAEGGEPGGSCGNGVGVLVETDHAEVVEPCQERFGMTSPADGGVDERAGGNRFENGHHLVHHDGTVVEVGVRHGGVA